MNWQDLARANKVYDGVSSYDEQYSAYLRDRDSERWWSPQGPGIAGARRMYRFLNQWKCRLRANESDCARLAEAAVIAAPLLEDLRAERLIDMDFSATRTSAIARSFDTLLSGLSKQSHTCAAKVLHMYNRSLFVMWDSSIRGGYAVAGDGDSYARVFLPRVQQLAREAVASAVAEGLAGRSEAATYIGIPLLGQTFGEDHGRVQLLQIHHEGCRLLESLRLVTGGGTVVIREAIAALVDEGRDLSEDEAAAVMRETMEEEATPAQFGAFVVALRPRLSHRGNRAGFLEPLGIADREVLHPRDRCGGRARRRDPAAPTAPAPARPTRGRCAASARPASRRCSVSRRR